MPRDWIKIAESRDIPPPQNTAPLDTIESIFRPLVAAIPFETEPAFVLLVHGPDAV